jgi:hypothetical protein
MPLVIFHAIGSHLGKLSGVVREREDTRKALFLTNALTGATLGFSKILPLATSFWTRQCPQMHP